MSNAARYSAAAAILVLGLAMAAGACGLFRDYPDTSCEADGDCFRAQGEVCDRMTNTCVIGSDAAPTPDAGPDAAPGAADAAADSDAAAAADAGVFDAGTGADV